MPCSATSSPASAPPTPAEPGPERSIVNGMDATRARTLTLVATILGSGIALLDATIVNVALPAIEEDLGGGLAGQQWVVNAYLLTLGSLILVGGSLGDLYGERRIFALGVAGFGVASLLCALAPTIETLVAARAVQGATSALLTPASLALIATTFEDEKERGAAIGTWTAWAGIAAVAGPVIGGQIVDVASWRWIFAVNVPLVLVTLALIYVAVERDEHVERKGRRIDVVGALLTAFGLAGPVFALVEQPQRGWTSPVVLLGLVGGAILLVAFVALGAARARPDAATRALREPQLLGHEHRDAARLRGARVALLLPDDLPPERGRLLSARERPCRPARDDLPLLPLEQDRRARPRGSGRDSSWESGRS